MACDEISMPHSLPLYLVVTGTPAGVCGGQRVTEGEVGCHDN
jgi:hypothetical protein